MNKACFISTFTSTLILSSVATLTLASNNRASDLASMLEAMPEIYGNIQFADVTTNPRGGTTTHEFQDNGSTIGIKHSHAVSEGVDAFLKAEFTFSADNSSSSAGINQIDEAYIGLKGDFGSAQVGSDDTVYEWITMIDTGEYIGLDAGELAATQFDGAGKSISNEGDNFQYSSPEIMGGLTFGVTVPFDSDTTFGGALAAKFSLDDLDVGLAYALGRQEGISEVGDSLGFSARYAMNDLTIIAQFETKDEGKSGALDGQDFWGFEGIYVMGQNIFSLAYGSTSYDLSASEDTSSIFVQALHNVSDNTYVYLEYSDFSDIKGTKNNDATALAVGAVYLF